MFDDKFLPSLFDGVLGSSKVASYVQEYNKQAFGINSGSDMRGAAGVLKVLTAELPVVASLVHTLKLNRYNFFKELKRFCQDGEAPQDLLKRIMATKVEPRDADDTHRAVMSYNELLVTLGNTLGLVRKEYSAIKAVLPEGMLVGEAILTYLTDDVNFDLLGEAAPSVATYVDKLAKLRLILESGLG